MKHLLTKKLLAIAILSTCLSGLAEAGQWYVFGEGGYSLLGSQSHNDTLLATDTNQSASIPNFSVVSSLSENFNSVGNNSAANFGGGFGYQFPFGNRAGILSSNSVELLVSHVAAINNVGVRSEYMLTEQNVVNGQPQEPLAINVLNQQESYTYQTANTRVLVNYVVNFKPFIAQLASFIELGAGANMASFSDYHEQDSATPQTGIDKVDFANHTKFNLAYNAGLGLSYQITQHWAVRMGYRYTNGGLSESGAVSQAASADGTDTVNFNGHIANHNASNEIYLRGLYYI